jgi:hypothetical protein
MTSLRKLIAVGAAVLPLAGSAQTPPAAPAPLAQLYGTFNVNLMYTGAPNPTAPGSNATTGGVRPRTAVSIDSSNIGIKGSAAVDFGLSVVYQCETSAQVDAQGSAPVICNRNSRLGLSSPVYGTIFYGNWDTPFKASYFGTKADDPFGNTDVYDSEGIMGSPGFLSRPGAGLTNTGTGTSVNFQNRAANSVAYWTPKIMGISARFQYSADENADNKKIRDPFLYSGAVNYDQGPISVFVAGEDHEDWISSNSHDYALRVGAGYELANPFGATTLGVVGEQLWYYSKVGFNPGTGTVKKYDRQAVQVGLKHRMGNHEFRARWQYADAGNAKAMDGSKVPTNGIGAKNYALGYAYYLSTAAQVYLYWTEMDNERFATYTFGTAGPAYVSTLQAGSDPWAVGLGLRYAF